MNGWQERTLLQVLQPHASPGPETRARSFDASQEPRIVLQPIVEPVVLGLEADQHARRPAVARNDDLAVLRLAEELREIVFHLGQRHFLHSSFPNCLSHDSASGLGTMAKTSTVEPATS